MTRVARETPPGSGTWIISGEPDPRHPRQAPQFACSLCGRVIGKTAPHHLLDNCRVVCQRCSHSQPAHARFYLDCPERWHDLLEHADAAFATRAVVAILLGIWPDPSRLTFRGWLQRFRKEESAIGDLARDALADNSWPRGPGSLARYAGYFEDIGASDAAVTMLRGAWARYERERGGT